MNFKTNKENCYFIRNNIKSLDLLDQIRVKFFDTISDDVIEEVKSLALSINEENNNLKIKFLDLISDLFITFDIEHDDFVLTTKSQLYHENPPEPANHKDMNDWLGDVKDYCIRTRKKNRSLEYEVNQFQSLSTDPNFVNYFKNNGIIAKIVPKSLDIIFLKKHHTISAHETEIKLDIAYVFNLKDFKITRHSMYPSLGYLVAITKKKENDVYSAFIYDFHLKALDENFQRKGVGRILEAELVNTLRRYNCFEIRGELSPVNMEDNNFRARLIGFWKAMGYEIYNREIFKKII